MEGSFDYSESVVFVPAEGTQACPDGAFPAPPGLFRGGPDGFVPFSGSSSSGPSGKGVLVSGKGEGASSGVFQLRFCREDEDLFL